MMTVYDIEVDSSTLGRNLERVRGQIFRCLPVREEGGEWRKPVETLVIETLGMHGLFPENADILTLACKLQGLLEGDEVDFMLYRRTIFEACGLATKAKVQCEQEVG